MDKENSSSQAGGAGASFSRLMEVVAGLRGENGCPWDRAQTFQSLKPCMINEMTEALAGIDLYESTGSAGNLCEELGDVLLQVVLLSRIAQELGLFTAEDVIDGVSAKMIRRHPHVFGEASVSEAAEVPGRWEEIKKEEKKNRTPEQERQEKAAFREAAAQVIRHLSADT